MRTFWVIAIWAAVLDWFSKDWASVYAPFVVFNTEASRFGLPASVTVMITLGVIAALAYLVSQHQHRVPGLAVSAGVMIGGAFGNLGSIYTGPPGVLDFIPFGGYSLGNLADIWLMAGGLWVWYVVARALVRERAATRGIVTDM